MGLLNGVFNVIKHQANSINTSKERNEDRSDRELMETMANTHSNFSDRVACGMLLKERGYGNQSEK